MKRVLCTALTALTILAAAFFASPLSRADGLTKSKASVTFNKDVAPILFKNCAECHRPGEAAPMSLLSYKDARPWARSIREKVVGREMPPWHADPHVGQFSNDASLTQNQIDTITAWVDGGAQEGDPRDLPPAPKFVEAYIAAQDPIFYTEGFLRRVKPNVSVFDDGCQLPNGGRGNQLDGSGELKFGPFLTRFLPGTKPPIWEPGTVRRIPAGAKILFEIHYAKTTGQIEKDRSTIGLVFAKHPPQKELFTAQVSNYYFRIPPGAENHRVTSCWTAPQDIHLVTARPHMHNRGKAMEIKA